MRKGGLITLLALGLAAANPLPPNPLPPDVRFGFTGTGSEPFAHKFGLPFYAVEGNYLGDNPLPFSLDPSWDPDPGFHAVRELGKLDQRTDSLGYTSEQFQAELESFARMLMIRSVLPLGDMPTWQPSEPDLDGIATYELPRLNSALQRLPGSTYWEVGNEPNLFPLLAPQDYAKLYAAYHARIKRASDSSRVGVGALFALELTPGLQPFLVANLRQFVEEGLREEGFHEQADDSVFVANLVEDLRAGVLQPIFEKTSLQYLREVLAALPDSVQPDWIGVHIYPFGEDSSFLQDTVLTRALNTYLDSLSALAAQYGIPEIWVTEFGNIVQELTEAQVTERNRLLIEAFSERDNIARWLYYKPTGGDFKLSLLANGEPPFTRLATDISFNPVSGGFPCAELNGNGLQYYRLAVGEPCEDGLGIGESPGWTRLLPAERVVWDRPLWIEAPAGKLEVEWYRLSGKRITRRFFSFSAPQKWDLRLSSPAPWEIRGGQYILKVAFPGGEELRFLVSFPQ